MPRQSPDDDQKAPTDANIRLALCWMEEVLNLIWRRFGSRVDGVMRRLIGIMVGCMWGALIGSAESWKLVPENINRAIAAAQPQLAADPFRPAFHLVPPAGCMGDPNGGIYKNGWYHIFVGQHPFAFHPGGWYWAHARSRDLLHWEHLPPQLTPGFEHGIHAVGSGSTITLKDGRTIAFYSSPIDDVMQFWRAEMSADLTTWSHPEPNPVLTLEHPGLPPFDDFWRDPYVFEAEGRTFMIACADLFDSARAPVPIFEARDDDLTDWEYRGIFFSAPKHDYRNLEVPEIRRLGDKWILLASTDAPVDRVVYFIGDIDFEALRFIPESDGVIDHSGHYYAQETIQNDANELYLMGWLPGWDRDWLPRYRNAPIKNNDPVWNGIYAVPRQLQLNADGILFQQPVVALRELRGEPQTLDTIELRVDSPNVPYVVLEEIRGDQMELRVELDLGTAAMCGLNLLASDAGHAGFFLQWSGNLLQVDGTEVPLAYWQPGDTVELQIFVDKRWVEVFIDGGRAVVSRQVPKEHIRGDRIALTTLGGTSRLVSFTAWPMASIDQPLTWNPAAP
jgi:beta-fructofuranosidase